MKKHLLLVFSIALCCSSCFQNSLDEDRIVQGYAPIYTNLEIGDLVSESPRPYDELVNFVIFEDLIFMVELVEGIHIVDNSNPNDPIDIGFLNVPGIIGVVITEDFALITTFNRLISIDISDINNAIVRSITETNIENELSLLPPDDLSDFECVDPTKGVLVGWEKKMLTNPQCWK